MKNKNSIKLLISGIVAVCLVALVATVTVLVYKFNKDEGQILDGGYKVEITQASGTTSADENVITPDEVEMEFSMKSLQNNLAYEGTQSKLPSIGAPKILVIPIEIPSFKFSSNDLIAIQNCFFGKASDTGWQSLNSYYYESSFQQLDIKGEVLPVFEAKSAGYNTVNSIISSSDVTKIIEAALSKNGISINDYDFDQDGFYDGIWTIYSAPNYQNNSMMNKNYWAYTSWNLEENNPLSVFAWASIDFIMNNFYGNLADAHTIIHETGHMMGLNDYYDYSGETAPAGCLDMMDANVLDHSSYSKMLLGWIKPYIVTGDSKISLATTQEKNACIVIPYDGYKINKSGDKYLFNPFDEYMLVELYSPEGLNEKDSMIAYENGAKGYSKTNFKVLHIDNRLFRFNARGLLTPYENGSSLSSRDVVCYFISNTTSGEYAESSFLGNNSLEVNGNIDDYFSEMTLIDSSKLFTYKNLYTKGSSFAREIVYASNSCLFASGDTFNMSTFHKYFVNGENRLMNNGQPFDSNLIFE